MPTVQAPHFAMRRFVETQWLRGWLGFVFALAIGPMAGASQPIASWNFSPEESTPLELHGGIHSDQPGPRPPEFPDMEPDNTAVLLDGQGAHFSLEDPGVSSSYDFTNGDSITLEAWVKLSKLRNGENLYVISKGRTKPVRDSLDNQNWALRICGVNGKACASFLFATNRSEDSRGSNAHWHRWTSIEGFDPTSGWHHVAVSYQFGTPESIRGWIDGVAVTGQWDMGGATTTAPVVDNDAIWIGSSQGGNASNSFRGSLDSIAIHRSILGDDVMKTRYRRDDSKATKARAAKEVRPTLEPLPVGLVVTTFHEGMPAHDRWLNTDEIWPKEATRWVSDAFLLPRLPQRFDDWGMRDAWRGAVLVRMAGNVRLRPGDIEFNLRARGLSRLWVNGTVIARTKPVKGSPSGEEEVKPIVDPIRPGVRRPGFGQQEVVGVATVPDDGWCEVVLECLVGGEKFRHEPGELCVAIAADDGESLYLLQPFDDDTPAKRLTDANIEPMIQEIQATLGEMDDFQRRNAASKQDAFWEKRHAVGREWAKSRTSSDASIDGFIEAKIRQASDEARSSDPEAARHFHESVLPILQENCFRCHGEKDNGGLRLSSREAMLQGGDSESPAVVPFDAVNSEAMIRIRSEDDDARMPPTGEPLSSEDIQVLAAWIEKGAVWSGTQITPEEVAKPPLVDDASFLRRVSLDTIGLPPTDSQIRDFLNDTSSDKRSHAIERLLANDSWADHWVSYWQDVLAENPTLLNQSLNSTGPFRLFLWDALRDNKPLDRWVTELIMMRGGKFEGGSAGFGMAGDNDAPLATKGQVLASAFLGIELQCARCHDSPYHSTLQKDLYSLAAMLDRKDITVPKTSMVPAAFFEKKERESLIRATLRPDTPVRAEWSFADVCNVVSDEEIDRLMQDPKDSRERLAALITSPRNDRFAKVVVNRIWRRLMGAGIVEPPQDWEGKEASHPELLDWLATELVMHDYDLKHVMRSILNSAAYQRQAVGYNMGAEPARRFFSAPDRRRLTAEQVVDSMYAASGMTMDIDELTFDPDSRRPASNRISLGFAKRAWMLVSLNNERDRPSLTLPKAQAVDDVLQAFGWTASRQMPRTDREIAPNVLQPGVLSNGTLTHWLTTASHRSTLAELAIDATSPETLVDTMFLRFLSRFPTSTERNEFAALLSKGFSERLIPNDQVRTPDPLPLLPRVTWSNHLVPEATTIQNENERRARKGSPPDPRLSAEWREVYEDMVWSLVNHREFVWVP